MSESAAETTSTNENFDSSEFPSPPWIHVPGVANFRDIGGYPISSGAGPGKSVRGNFIFRSAEPGKITEEGKSIMKELGIKKVYDLRSVPELKRLGEMAQVADIEGVERVFIPVHRDVDYSPEALAARYNQYMSGNLHNAYQNILHGDPTAYRTIFTHLLNADPSTSPEPVLIHCTAGKDRTGIICALVLLLAGVADNIIATEYSLTTSGLTVMREKIVEYLMKDKASLKNGGRAGAENMLSSKPETMYKFLEILREEFGGVEGYLTKYCGFTKEEIEKIRANIVCNEEPVCRL